MDANRVGIEPQSSNLIASDRVEGTEVRRSDGARLGVIRRLMIDKPSGQVVYAIMATESTDQASRQRALPWKLLAYNSDLNAYELDLTDEQLGSAPHRDETTGDPSFDRSWEEHVHSYFQTAPYWQSETGRATDVPFGKDHQDPL
jgi:hypothetical protein